MKMAMRILSGLLRKGIVAGLAAAFLAVPAAAQSTRVFSNTTTGAISNATPCSTPLVRNFTVNSNFIVGSVNLGLLASHTWRNDIRLTLQSPDGTRQQIVDGNEAVFVGQNFNVRLSDNGTQLVNTENPPIDHSTGPAPPYQHNYIPNAPLSVFNGQTSAGTWRLEICDIFPDLDNGTFLRADLFLTPATNASGTGATFVVNSTANTGTGTLRQAVVDANATPAEADTIAFAIPGAGPHSIILSSALPDITDNGLLIDGATQSGSQCRNIWNGDAHILRVNVRGGTGFDGFRLAGSNQTIRGLSISGFANGVALLAASNTSTIRCNFIGLLADGSSNGNSQRGVTVFGASARIGGLNAGEGNIISANATGVLTNNGSTDTSVQGNFIGTDIVGMAARGNSTAINNFNGSATWRDITRNLISGNTNGAIVLESDDVISPSTDQIRIQRNVIGFDRTLSALMRNGGDGIRFQSGSISNLLIGGVAASQGNTITGNEHGVSLTNLENVLIRGNIIARSLRHGMRLSNMRNTTVGGDAATQANVIGGSGWSGIIALNSSDNITIIGNQIGRVTITGGDFDNQQRGIMLDNVSNVSIGNGTAAGRNLISRNGGRGIMGTGTISGVTINGNYIGTDATGNIAVTNGWTEGMGLKDAISFEDDGNFTNISVLNNVIGGYQDALIEFWRSTANGITIQGNNIGVGADGVSPIVSGNTEDLIYIGAGAAGETRAFSNVLIGGSGLGQGNLIAFSNRSGIRLDSAGSNIQVIGNTIRNNSRNGIHLLNNPTRAAIISNSIYDNGLLGIDLGDDGVTLNDPGDGDSGPNDLLNFPVINAAHVVSPLELTGGYTLDAPAGTYRIEFFANSVADPSGHGEGERFIGHDEIAHPGGEQTYTGTLSTIVPVAIGEIISATATRRGVGGEWEITSEFSAVVTAEGTAQLELEVLTELFETPPENPFATPGNDILLTTTVTNTGTGSTDADSIFAVVTINPANSFLNEATPALGGIVGFSSGSPTLTFDPSGDLAFSNDAAQPTSLAQCTYTPITGYDPDVRHVCLNPKGSLPAGLPEGTFTVQLRARIN